jgi:hypothetical protein
MKIAHALRLTLVSAICIVAGCSQSKTEPEAAGNLANLQVAHSMKGWELYTWPEASSWKFSFMQGTNRLKTLSEVTSSSSDAVLIRVTGVDSARMVLDRFPKGEAITLIGQGWLKNMWQGQYGDLKLPPQTTIDELKSFATLKGLTFTVTK